MQSLSLTVKPITITQGALLKLSSALFSVGAADYSLSISVLGGTLFQNGTEIGASGSFSLAELKLDKITFLADGTSLPGFFFNASASGFVNSAEVQPILTYKAVNQAPVVSIPGLGSNGDALLKGGTITITRDMLSASDAETPDAGNLQVKITTVKGGGFLLNGYAAKSFSLADVDNGSVSFKHDGKLLSPSFSLSVSDSDGKASSVKSTNSATVVFDGSQTAEALPSNPHEIAVKTPLALTEGATLKLTAKNLPIAVSTDVVPLLQQPTLQLRIDTADHCKVMVSGSAVVSFTLAQLKAGLVTLIHDGSQEAPALELSLLNGATVLDSLHLPCAFKTVNDLPTLSMNSLVLNPGETKLLDLGHFNVADEETPEALEGAYRFAVKSASGIAFHRSGVAAAIKNFSLAEVDAGLISISRLSTFVGTPTYALSVADPTGKFSISASGTVLTNHSPQGSVIISGTVSEGQVLTASDTLLDSDAVGSISYTWLNATGDVLGNGAHLTLTQAHVGKQIKVVGSYVDGQGTAEAKASSLSAVVANLNDAPTGYLLIEGSAVLGNTLHAKTDFTDWDAAYLNLADEDGGMGALSFTWSRVNDDGSLSFLGTGSSYTLTGADVGKSIALSATYTDGEGHVETVEAYEATEAVVAPGIALSGSPAFLDSLSVDVTLPDAASTATLSYSWKSSPSGTAGTWTQFSTAANVIPDYTRYGQFISVEVSYTDANGQVHSYTSAPKQFDQDLSASIDVAWDATAHSFTASNPLGLPSSALVWHATVGGVDTVVGYGTSLSVSDTMTNVNLQIAGSNGTTVSSAPIANDPLSGAWEISRSGANLSITKKDMSDADGIRSMFYSWQDSNGIEIGNGASFNIDAPYGGSPTQVNTKFKVVVSYADQKGDTDIYIIDDIIIRNHDHTTWDVNPASLVTEYYGVGTLGYLNDADIRVKSGHTGEVSVSGQTTAGKILTADTTPITDDDGKPETGFNYVWEKSRAGDGVIWQTIVGQTQSTLTLDNSLAGYTVRSRVEFTDLRGSQEISYSKATDAVLPHFEGPLVILGELVPTVATSHEDYTSLNFINYASNTIVYQDKRQSLQGYDNLHSADGRAIRITYKWHDLNGQEIDNNTPGVRLKLSAICEDEDGNRVTVDAPASFIVKPPITETLQVTRETNTTTQETFYGPMTILTDTAQAIPISSKDFKDFNGNWQSYSTQISFDGGKTWEAYQLNGNSSNVSLATGAANLTGSVRFVCNYSSTYGDTSTIYSAAMPLYYWHEYLLLPGHTHSESSGANSLVISDSFKDPNDPKATMSSTTATWINNGSTTLVYDPTNNTYQAVLPAAQRLPSANGNTVTGVDHYSFYTFESSQDGINWQGGAFPYQRQFDDELQHVITYSYWGGSELKLRFKYEVHSSITSKDTAGNITGLSKHIVGYSNIVTTHNKVNQPFTGDLIIQDGMSFNNDVHVGDYLYADLNGYDPDGMGPVLYTWMLNGQEISHNTNFYVTQDMLGQKVTLTASYTDGLEEYVELEDSTPTIIPSPYGTNTPPEITRSLNLDLIDDQWHQITLADLQGTDAEDGEYASRLTFKPSALPVGFDIVVGKNPDTGRVVTQNDPKGFTLKDIITNEVWVKVDYLQAATSISNLGGLTAGAGGLPFELSLSMKLLDVPMAYDNEPGKVEATMGNKAPVIRVNSVADFDLTINLADNLVRNNFETSGYFSNSWDPAISIDLDDYIHPMDPDGDSLSWSVVGYNVKNKVLTEGIDFRWDKITHKIGLIARNVRTNDANNDTSSDKFTTNLSKLDVVIQDSKGLSTDIILPFFYLKSMRSSADAVFKDRKIISYGYSDSTAHEDIIGPSKIPIKYHSLIAGMFKYIESIINVKFIEVVDISQANITLGAAQKILHNNAEGVTFPVNDHRAEIYVAELTDESMKSGGYTFTSFLHEIGHSLGLQHPGSWGVGESPDDNRSHALMSYIRRFIYQGIDDSTFMQHDIIELQNKFGENISSMYDFNYSRMSKSAETIWSGFQNTNDNFDMSAADKNIIIDLRPGFFSSIGLKENISIAYNCNIENATGGKGNDIIHGNVSVNTIHGGEGHDVIDGDAGNDLIFGDGGDDTFIVKSTSPLDIDKYNGGEGQDTLLIEMNDTFIRLGDIFESIESVEIIKLKSMGHNSTLFIDMNALNRVSITKVSIIMDSDLGGRIYVDLDKSESQYSETDLTEKLLTIKMSGNSGEYLPIQEENNMWAWVSPVEASPTIWTASSVNVV